jgi:hypothetical protein
MNFSHTSIPNNPSIKCYSRNRISEHSDSQNGFGPNDAKGRWRIMSCTGVIEPASVRGIVRIAIPREAETVPRSIILYRQDAEILVAILNSQLSAAKQSHLIGETPRSVAVGGERNAVGGGSYFSLGKGTDRRVWSTATREESQRAEQTEKNHSYLGKAHLATDSCWESQEGGKVCPIGKHIPARTSSRFMLKRSALRIPL